MGYVIFLESFCPNDLYNNIHALGCLALVVVSVYFRVYFLLFFLLFNFDFGDGVVPKSLA